MGRVNAIFFEFHDFPNNFCGHCDIIGHKVQNCILYNMAQHQAEVHQAHANAALVAMQQEVVIQQEQMHPVMVQEGMEFSEDSISSSISEQNATEVRCSEYLKQLEVDFNGLAEIGNNTGNGTLAPGVTNETVQHDQFFRNRNLDTYMWKMMQKKGKTRKSFQLFQWSMGWSFYFISTASRWCKQGLCEELDFGAELFPLGKPSSNSQKTKTGRT